MRTFAIAFLLATCGVQHSASLVEPWLPLLAGGLVALLTALRARGVVRSIFFAAAGLAFGFGLATGRAHERLSDELPKPWEGRDITLEGVVVGLPQRTDRGIRFLLEPKTILTEGAQLPSLFSVTWYNPSKPGSVMPTVQAGERWQMTVRLRRPRGLANPHGFEFESWALQRGIRATGYVRPAPAPERLAEYEVGWPQTLHRARGLLRDQLLETLGESKQAGVIVALVLGDQASIAREDWRVLWRTGVGHLMSISGLHVTMFATLAGAWVLRLWSWFPALVRAVPARSVAALAGVLAALAYTLIAGYAVPAQRTLVMLAVAAASLAFASNARPSLVLAVAAIAVLLLDPWAVLAPGFWLSFGAVGALLAVTAGRVGQPGWLAGAIAAQAAVTIALWPALALLFGEASLVSPLANAVAIPVVSLVVVPLSMLGCLPGLEWLLPWADAALTLLMAVLRPLASPSWAVVENPVPPLSLAALAVAGGALLLLPRGVPLRVVGVVLLLPTMLYLPPSPSPGEAWVDVLDVGQGLAVVIRTTNHALAYDAGPSWGPDSDAGDRVVVPFLRGEGVRRLDGLVVTHADDDHLGGALSVAIERQPGWLLSPLAWEDPLHALVPVSLPCIAPGDWEWDGVRFAVLHPGPAAWAEPPARENDRSCVIRVATAGGSVLLTGDIEKRAEYSLARQYGDLLRSNVLLVPHHGSKTSSTESFLAVVQPSDAVFSAGWANRFRHPAAEVLQRYEVRGIARHRTDVSGALRVALPAGGDQAPAVFPLVTRRRYWDEREP